MSMTKMAVIFLYPYKFQAYCPGHTVPLSRLCVRQWLAVGKYFNMYPSLTTSRFNRKSITPDCNLILTITLTLTLTNH